MANLGYYIAIGNTGWDVQALQLALNRAGAKLAVDGVCGPKTQTAIRKFQRAKALKVDGLAGPSTWKVLGPYARQTPALTTAKLAARELVSVRNNAMAWSIATQDGALATAVDACDRALAEAVGLRTGAQMELSGFPPIGPLAIAAGRVVARIVAKNAPRVIRACGRIAATLASACVRASKRARAGIRNYLGKAKRRTGQTVKADMIGNAKADFAKLARRAGRVVAWLGSGLAIGTTLLTTAAKGVVVGAEMLLMLGGLALAMAQSKGSR